MTLLSIAGFSLDVQGHRGSRALKPENTLPGFLSGIESGAQFLELDILVTADNHLVIHHDFFLNKDLCRYLDGKEVTQEVLIRSLSLSDLKKIDAGKSNPSFPFQQALPGTQIPSLQDLFDLMKTCNHPNAQKIKLNLELKRDLRFPEWTLPPLDLATAITDLVEKNGFSDRVYYSSFDPEVLIAIRKANPKAQTGFIFSSQSLDVARILHPEAGMEFLLKIASFLEVSILSPDHALLQTKEDVLLLQKKGFKVIPWTVNDPKRWKELSEMGVDGMISDDPEALVQFLQKTNSILNY